MSQMTVADVSVPCTARGTRVNAASVRWARSPARGSSREMRVRRLDAGQEGEKIDQVSVMESERKPGRLTLG